ncbi:MAG: Holliday junction resolvase RuvX [Acidimicrobiia bacterium]
MTRILGVDLGSRRIGLALSDPLGVTASPLRVLDRKVAHEADHRAIVEVAREVDARRIVVGLPRALSGKLGPVERATRVEVDELRAVAGPDLPVETYDERFTTVIAQRSLIDAKVRRKDRKQVVDKVAAAVMLQGYLEARS